MKLHKFHIVDPSPWPFLASVWSGIIIVSFLDYVYCGGWFFFVSIFGLLFVVYFWSRDVVREVTFEGHHTSSVQNGLKLGFIFFIVSEIMFFFSFFWSYFHYSFCPSMDIGCAWPPFFIKVFDALGVPLLNTYILLFSGLTVTLCHYFIIQGNYKKSLQYLYYTILLAFFFTLLQYYEYCSAPFSINDSVYGSIFFLLTGFHGAHVVIGTILLIICYIRLILKHFTRQHHLGFECSAWYWHFVDVVWLFLYILVYWLSYLNVFFG